MFLVFLIGGTREQKRNDREEIRRRLAMGAEDDYLAKISATKTTRKSTLQSRIQEGIHLIQFFHSLFPVCVGYIGLIGGFDFLT